MMYVHYHRNTGRIGAWGNAESETSHLPDHLVVQLDTDTVIDPRRQRIAEGALADISSDDLEAWNCPSPDEMAARIEMELQNTDQFMMPDRDVLREPWVAYRRALRDLSKLPDAAAQLAAWPARPDKKEN